MANRLDLQALLEDLLGSRNVYYQPPESVKMNYPAIVYACLLYTAMIMLIHIQKLVMGK